MAKYQIETDGGTYEVETDDGAIANKQDSVISQGIGYVSQHPFKTALQPLTQTITGKTAQDMAIEASRIGMGNAPANALTWPTQFAKTAISGMAGSAVDMATTPSNYMLAPVLGKLGKTIGDFKIYNDKLISDTAKSVISKVQDKVQPLRDLYLTITNPHAERLIDSDTFQKALNSVPKSIRQDFIDEYATKMVDASGKPQTTVGNLHKMELELKDFINQPKFGQKINAAEYNVAVSSKKLKNIRLSQLPEDAQKAIKTLDEKFAPVINASNELLPKLADKSGKVNTKFLYNTFNNASDAGTRQYLNDLKNIGINIEPEIKILKGWVSRQAMKKGANNLWGKAVEGAVLGGVLKK